MIKKIKKKKMLKINNSVKIYKYKCMYLRVRMGVEHRVQ